MADRITLTRRAAWLKLSSCTRATYFIEVFEGRRHERPVPVEEMVQAFKRDPRARLRIRLSDSKHTVTIENSRECRSGYDVEF